LFTPPFFRPRFFLCLLSKVSKKIGAEGKAKLAALLKKYNVGWIVNERFVNLPVQISGPVYSTLQVKPSLSLSLSLSLFLSLYGSLPPPPPPPPTVSYLSVQPELLSTAA